MQITDSLLPMTNIELSRAVKILKSSIHNWAPTAIAKVARKERSPYQILISCLLSLRTKDEVTAEASQRLFLLAKTPRQMSNLSLPAIEKAIYPVGFYRNKARVLKNISKVLLEKYGGDVPDDLEELLTLKGVGRKTANLVITVGFGLPGICVDTHVHRITNRWGYVSSRDPKETEFALRERLPKRYWIDINDLLVTFGQNVCKPISPLCSQCLIQQFCRKIGVTKHR